MYKKLIACCALGVVCNLWSRQITVRFHNDYAHPKTCNLSQTGNTFSLNCNGTIHGNLRGCCFPELEIAIPGHPPYATFSVSPQLPGHCQLYQGALPIQHGQNICNLGYSQPIHL